MDHLPDPHHPTDSVEAERLALSRRIARVVLAIALVGLGAWILHRFLAALAWAGVLAIALWPLYRRLAVALPEGKSRILAPLLFTLSVGLIFTVPFIYVAIEGAREVRIIVQFLGEAEHNGVPVPEWVPQFPVVGRVRRGVVARQSERPQCGSGAAGKDQSAIGRCIGPALRPRNHSPIDHLRVHPSDLVFPVPRRNAVQPAAAARQRPAARPGWGADRPPCGSGGARDRKRPGAGRAGGRRADRESPISSPAFPIRSR